MVQVFEVVGENIRARRKARRWTQQKLAEAAGLSTYFIGAVERGQAVVSLRALDQIARALKVPLSVLVEQTDDSDRKELYEAVLTCLKRADAEELRVILEMCGLLVGRR